MSGAIEAQPPNQSTNGISANNAPPSKSTYNSWTENKKIKTCKCTVCDERVRVSSQKCSGCGRHVCSDCLNPASTKDEYYKSAAQNRMEVGCWACNWRSNMNPAFARRKPAPEIRIEEERKARASKALGARRKVAKQKPRQSRSYVEDHDARNFEERTDLIRPEDDYAGTLSFNVDTITKDRNRRSGIKRKRYIEDDSDPELFVTTEKNNVDAKPKRPGDIDQHHDNKAQTSMVPNLLTPIERPEVSPLSEPLRHSPVLSVAPHLEGRSSVIIGAGIVGLFVAYQLALKLHQEDINHDIMVIDIRESFGALATRNSAGILSTSGVPEDWSQITEEAQKQWQELKANKDFLYNVYLSSDTFFRVDDHGSSSTGKAPTWFPGSSGCSFLNDPQSFGRVESNALSSWLYTQCTALNVRFLFNHSINSTKFLADSNLTRVYVDDGKGKTSDIPCHNLILTAGPFTTGIFDKLFDKSLVKLENNIRNIHWFRIPLESVTKADSIALQLVGAASDGERLENDLTMALSSNERIVTVSAMSLNSVSGNLELKHARQPSIGKTSDLRRIASKYLNVEGVDVTNQKIYSWQGASQISTANHDNPIIDKVPTSSLGNNYDDMDDANPCGVWLCYGFGYHGTTLAPGAARMLVSRIFYGANGVDNYDFSLPQYAKSAPVGKGKGLA